MSNWLRWNSSDPLKYQGFGLFPLLQNEVTKRTMAITTNNPVEYMRLGIEFANNGIILRDPDDEDEVTLALTGPATHKPEGYGYDIDHSEEYRAIGKMIYDWLREVALPDNADHWVSTGANLIVKAELTGRAL